MFIYICILIKNIMISFIIITIGSISMKLNIKKHLTRLGLAIILGGYAAQFGIPIWMNSQFRDIGEGYSVREICNERQFYIGSYAGAARLCIDNGMDGTLDQTWVNAPISPMMGGPGYRLMVTKTTEEDYKRFGKANVKIFGS